MKQIKNDKKKIILLCLLSAGLAGIVFAVFCIIQGIAPFGDMSILRNDANAQYAPFLANYVERIKSGSSLLYSWNIGAGINEFGLVAYYLASPFNLLALPFNSSNIEIAFWMIILVKTMCIGLTACYYFQKKFNDASLLNIIFSIVYTFSGFYICYYYNTMWLDALIMLPLIALGIENIVNGKKATLYFCSLAYAIFVNFYLGYMICIFSVLYFFYLLFSKDVTRNSSEKAEDEAPIGTVLVKYGFASLLAGLVCAVVIIPVLYAISQTASKADFTTDTSFFNFLDFLSYHLTGVAPVSIESTASTGPYVMSSIITLLSLPLFFFAKNIKANKKIATLVVLVLFYFSFSIPEMNYFWHGFSAPSGLPYRFTFIYLFFIISIAYESIKNIKDIPVWAFGISGVLIAAACVYTKFSKFSSHFSEKTVIVSVAAFVAYAVLLLLAKYDKLNRKAFAVMLSIIIAAELIVGNADSFKAFKTRSEQYNLVGEIDSLRNIMDNDYGSDDYRFEVITKDNDNSLSAIYNYNGISAFTSLTDTQFSMSEYTLGLWGNRLNGYIYNTQTPIYNSLHALNYVFDTVGTIDGNSPFYEKLSSTENGVLYRVVGSLPFGICVGEKIDKWDPYSYLTVSVQQLLWSAVSGTDNVFTGLTADDIVYNSCNAVAFSEISKYINDNVDYSDYEEADEHEHEHEHDNDHETADADLYENADVYAFTVENLAGVVDAIGNMYPFNATNDGFSVEFRFTAKEDAEIFALINSGSMQTVTLKRADGTQKNINIADRHLSDLGYFKTGEEFTLEVKDPDRNLADYDSDYPMTDSIQMSVASVNEEKFLEGYNQILKNGTLKADEFDDTYIHGTVNSTIDGYMMMPMPYDLGWTIWVDGEEIEPHEHESHIMMFEITKGQHEIEMKYFPQGLKEGIFVSVAALLGLVFVLLLGRVHKMKLEFEAEEEAKKAAEAADGDAQSVSVSAQGEGEADGASPPDSEE